MKTLVKNVLSLGIIVFFISTCGSVYAQNGNGDFITVSGQLKDAKSGEKIIYANVSLPGTGIGTV